MARKSRRHLQNSFLFHTPIAPEPVRPSLLPTAAYIRLSVKDRAQKGDSIETQNMILQDFILNSQDLTLHNTYIDNGSTGTHFDRPAFQRMLADIEAGQIRCVIVKDLSRLGRNAIDAGYYIEKYFPVKGVRFIAVVDQFDSTADNAGILLALKNIVNEAYSVDIGKKIKSQARRAMKAGEFVGGRPPYGYLKSPDNCHKLVVDEPAAKVVRDIFQWAGEGLGLNTIVRRLNDAKVPTPSHYKREQGLIALQNLMGHGVWQTRTVTKILSNEVYTGNLVQGKTQKQTGQPQRLADPADWIRVEQTHEPIISRELFEMVQIKRQQTAEQCVQRPKSPYTPNIFKGKVFCAHCGKSLHRQRSHGIYRFHCITNSRVAKGACEAGVCSIRESTLIDFVMDVLRSYSDADLDGIIKERISGADQMKLVDIDAVQATITEKQLLMRSLYDSLADRIITPKEYAELKNGYKAELSALNAQLVGLKQALAKQEADTGQLLDLSAILKDLDAVTELTHELVEKLIDRITVDRDGKIDVRLQYSDILPGVRHGQ